VWLVVIGSALAEAAYFYATSRAYTLGDLSVAYPLARGSAPLFITLWAVVFLRERPSALGGGRHRDDCGGLVSGQLAGLARRGSPAARAGAAASRWALAARFLISIYSALDKVGVRFISPLLYLYLVLVVTWLVMTPRWCWRGRPACWRPSGVRTSGRHLRGIAVVAAIRWRSPPCSAAQ